MLEHHLIVAELSKIKKAKTTQLKIIKNDLELEIPPWIETSLPGNGWGVSPTFERPQDHNGLQGNIWDRR